MENRNQSRPAPSSPRWPTSQPPWADRLIYMKQSLLDRLNQDPASFAQIETEIHDRFRRLADQMTASLLAETTIAADRTQPVQKGGPAEAATDRNVPRRRGGLSTGPLGGLIVWIATRIQENNSSGLGGGMMTDHFSRPGSR